MIKHAKKMFSTTSHCCLTKHKTKKIRICLCKQKAFSCFGVKIKWLAHLSSAYLWQSRPHTTTAPFHVYYLKFWPLGYLFISCDFHIVIWNNGLPTRGKIKEEKLGKRRRRLLKRVPHGQVTMELSLSVSVRSIAKRAKMVVAESWNGLHKALFMPSTRHPHHSNQEWGQWKLVLALASMFTQGGVGS